jgi:glycosyltransferase involved in cell wall biosynthesis
MRRLDLKPACGDRAAMRIGLTWRNCAGTNYRAIEPLKAMVRRGHEVVWPLDPDGGVDLRRLAACEVVHVYRRADRQAMALARNGVPIVYDNDDDFAEGMQHHPEHDRDFVGLRGQQELASTLKMARLARVFTTTTEVIAQKYGRAGVEHVEVIANYLPHDAADPVVRADTGVVVGWAAPDKPARASRSPSSALVIGWVAGGEHRADVERIEIVPALGRLLAEHAHARVESIGLELGLSDRYRHEPGVSFAELPDRIRRFDVGIAPLADIPFNWARSDIKLKEYAASGVPWLASPVGPYQGLGEEQGGRLVSDDGWFEALDRLVSRPRERRRLARQAQRWAKRQTIDAVADRWEQVFAHAAGGPC